MHPSSMCIEYICRGARCGMDPAAGEASRAWRPGTHQGRRPRFYSAVSGGAGRGPPRAVPRGAPDCAPRAARGWLWRASTRFSSSRAASAFCAIPELRYYRSRPASKKRVGPVWLDKNMKVYCTYMLECVPASERGVWGRGGGWINASPPTLGQLQLRHQTCPTPLRHLPF